MDLSISGLIPGWNSTASQVTSPLLPAGQLRLVCFTSAAGGGRCLMADLRHKQIKLSRGCSLGPRRVCHESDCHWAFSWKGSDKFSSLCVWVRFTWQNVYIHSKFSHTHECWVILTFYWSLIHTLITNLDLDYWQYKNEHNQHNYIIYSSSFLNIEVKYVF